MRLLASFPTRAAASFALVIALVAAGASFAVRTMVLATKREELFKSRVQELRVAERARFAAENVVSTGRGYLLAGNPALRLRTIQSREVFDQTLRDLRSSDLELDQEAEAVLRRVELAAAEYKRVQDGLLAIESSAPPDLRELGRRFEQELVPRREDLDESLDALVGQVEAALERTSVVEQKAQQRAVLVSVIAVATGTVLSIVLAWLFGRKLSEMYRREREAFGRAEKATVAREDLLAIVAHDLRSPLSAITLGAAVLKARVTDERLVAQAARIENVATRMEFLVKSLLDGASIEARTLSLVPTPCSSAALVDETLEMFEGLATKKGIRIDLDLDKPDPVVLADSERVMQVLSNLLANSIKFTPTGGRITLRTCAEDDTVIFTVADTGPGIAAEHLPHVFERFWKGEPGGTRGAGLGMSIAKGIVEAHGGRIWVESELDRGTAFHFTIPSAAVIRRDRPPFPRTDVHA